MRVFERTSMRRDDDASNQVWFAWVPSALTLPQHLALDTTVSKLTNNVSTIDMSINCKY